jgi:hypothetical protein
MLVALSKKKFGANGFSQRLLINKETTASLVGFQRLSKKVILLGSQRYIGDVIKTNMFLSGRIRLFTGICIFQTRLLQN